jgi:hypothetical protein
VAIMAMTERVRIRSRRKRMLAAMFVLSVLATGTSGPALADRISDFEGGMAYDNNIGNARFRSDIRGDFALNLGTSQGVVAQINDTDSVTLTGDLKGQSFHRFSGMSNLSLGATLGYRRKIGMGATAPWLSASTSAARLKFQNEVRDGWQYAAVIRAGRRVDEHWDLNAEYRFEKRTGDNENPEVPGISGAVFDLRGHSLGLNAGYAWNDKTLLSMSYSYRAGDVVSTSRPNAGIFLVSSAIAEDPVFGEGAYAYRLRASTQLVSLRLSQAIGGNASINLGLQRQFTHGDGGNTYNTNLVDLSYLYSF